MTQDRIPSALVAGALAIVGSALVLARRLGVRGGAPAHQLRRVP